MTNFRNGFLILIFEKEKSLPITLHVLVSFKLKQTSKSEVLDFLTLLVQRCINDTSRKRVQEKPLFTNTYTCIYILDRLFCCFDSSTPGVDDVDGLSSTPKRNTKFERK
jgi:hypothetical protein